MTKEETIRNANDIDIRWPREDLLEAVGFEKRVRGRVEEYLENENIRELSLRDLMDLFLPRYTSPPHDDEFRFWRGVPILRQPQFGPYLHDSALLTLTETDLGQAYSVEWALRICRLKLYELRQRPTNRRRRRAMKKHVAAKIIQFRNRK